MLEVKRNTSMSNYLETPKRGSYLDFVSWIQGQNSRVQLSNYQALSVCFFGIKLNLIAN